jgi:hypothetical protein
LANLNLRCMILYNRESRCMLEHGHDLSHMDESVKSRSCIGSS